MKVMSVMDGRGMLRWEQNRGWGAKGVLDASGIRKYLWTRGFLREVKEHFAMIFEPVLYLFYKFTSILASSAIKVR